MQAINNTLVVVKKPYAGVFTSFVEAKAIHTKIENYNRQNALEVIHIVECEKWIFHSSLAKVCTVCSVEKVA